MLLASHGHEVIFFQKPLFPFGGFGRRGSELASAGIMLRQSYQLIHHQLRVLWLFALINSFFEKISIKKCFGATLDDSFVIVNFNYDYFFLRDLFPKNKIITIINDDFVAQSKFNSGRHAIRALRKTCEKSDLVLTVSVPILKQLDAWSNAQLFLPWADSAYRAPKTYIDKDAVLLWAHLDRRVDYVLLQEAALSTPHIFYFLVGPQSYESIEEIHSLLGSCGNIIVLPPTSLEHLPLERFFAAIIPYKSGIADIEAVTLSNKSFQLMCRGLPLVVHGMPYFLEHAAISKCGDSQEFVRAIESRRSSFESIQDSIADLIESNQASSRYSTLMALLNDDLRSI